jgi:hypothetical protein
MKLAENRLTRSHQDGRRQPAGPTDQEVVQQRPHSLTGSASSRRVRASVTRLQTATARSSGRRGRRFKSCYPDHCSTLSELLYLDPTDPMRSSPRRLAVKINIADILGSCGQGTLKPPRQRTAPVAANQRWSAARFGAPGPWADYFWPGRLSRCDAGRCGCLASRCARLS